MTRSNKDKVCSVCGKSFKPWSLTKARYCSVDCQKEDQYRKRIVAVKESGLWTSGWSSPKGIKAALLRERGSRCEVCGTTEWMGQLVPLVMDHVDGNAENWIDSNLRLVCGNCDMQLPTYKSKNKGSGRHSRRKRYEDGKSY